MTTPSFEQALSELESIVKKLEEGNMPLEDSLKAYEKGIALKKLCDQKLNQAQLKIEEIVARGDQVDTQPFIAKPL